MARRLQLEAEAEAARLKAENETRALVERQKAAEALENHPGLLRLAELEALANWPTTLTPGFIWVWAMECSKSATQRVAANDDRG